MWFVKRKPTPRIKSKTRIQRKPCESIRGWSTKNPFIKVFPPGQLHPVNPTNVWRWTPYTWWIDELTEPKHMHWQWHLDQRRWQGYCQNARGCGSQNECDQGWLEWVQHHAQGVIQGRGIGYWFGQITRFQKENRKRWIDLAVGSRQNYSPRNTWKCICNLTRASRWWRCLICRLNHPRHDFYGKRCHLCEFRRETANQPQGWDIAWYRTRGLENIKGTVWRVRMHSALRWLAPTACESQSTGPAHS